MKIEEYKTFKPSDDFRSYPSFGADLGVYMYQRIYKWFGIQIGAEYSALTVRKGKYYFIAYCPLEQIVVNFDNLKDWLAPIFEIIFEQKI